MQLSAEAIESGAVGAAITLAGVIGVAFLHVNIDRLAEHWGWDRALVRFISALPRWTRAMIEGWTAIRRVWWVWLILGLSAGFGFSPQGMTILRRFTPESWMTTILSSPSHPTTAPPKKQEIVGIPTNLSLLFKKAGDQPEEIDKKNIKFSVLFIPTLKDAGCSFRLNPQSMYQIGHDYLSQSNANGQSPCLSEDYEQTYHMLLIMYFDANIVYKTISVDGHGKIVPDWKTLESNDKMAVLLFDVSPSDVLLDIRVSN